MKDIFQKYISSRWWYVRIVIYSSFIYKINITFHVNEQYMYIINFITVWKWCLFAVWHKKRIRNINVVVYNSYHISYLLNVLAYIQPFVANEHNTSLWLYRSIEVVQTHTPEKRLVCFSHSLQPSCELWVGVPKMTIHRWE